LCLRKEFEGLEVRQLKGLNFALLGKWCWRMLVDKGGFLFRVLVARYGEVGGRLEVGGRSCSSWWREVVMIKVGVGSVGGGWFDECVSRKVGDGVDTLFWYDRWLGAVPLCVHFRRLFDLAENKSITVANLFSLGLKRGEAWKWRSRLWAWEEELLEECMTLLFGVSLETNFSDQWLWLPDSSGGYSDRVAYHLLTTKDIPLADSTAELIWHNQVPLKVSVFVWRLLCDRFSTKSYLVNRGVISSEAGLCVSRCGLVETTQHLFLTCTTFASLWPLGRDWIGFARVDSDIMSDNFLQFIHSIGGGKATRSFLQLIWLLCDWVV